ncbi:TonB-dependent receptor plug domain-containing protein [Sphingomonas sp. VNH70]
MRSALLLSGAVCALSVPPAARAQAAGPVPAETPAAQAAAPASDQAPVPPADDAQATDAAVSDIVVTGSRIKADGYTAPTPTTVLGAEQLAGSAQPNVFNAITQLPSLQGSTGASVGTNNTSTGQNGLSSFNLRGLGTIRTLTLLDGQRIVPANVTGVPDVSQLPQLLIQRVDVVTGGASASYGSDAVAGVINFVTDTKFEGFKANVLGSITTYGDNETVTAQAAWGRAFADDRLRVIVSGEYSYEGGIPGNGFGNGPGPNGRTWFRAPSLQVRTIANTPAGAPQITRILNAQDFQFAKYGLITSGPLQGTAFDVNGAPFAFQYGSNGLATGTGAVTGCITPFCVGGDTSGNVGNGTSMVAKLARLNGYGRIAYDLGDRNILFATVNVSRVTSRNTPNPGAFKNANLTIQCGNPFVPASIQARCAAAGITSFQYGVSNAVLPEFISVNPTREQSRFVIGMDGRGELLGTEWTYNSYLQYGINKTAIDVEDITLTPRYNAAIDAVRDASGAIVCRSEAARASGCVPLNIIGGLAPSAATLAYITPANGPFQRVRQTETAFSGSISGNPVDLWAGPLSVAAGVEYRREAYRARADAYGAGVTAVSPNTPDYPADPLLNSALGNNWYAGNFKNGNGRYHVWESFVEFDTPLFDSDALGTANLNVAGRATQYSTSGFVATWKVGGTWETPLDGLRVRSVISKDVRAPNLSELFAPPTIINITVNDPVSRTAVTAQSRAIGNPDLRPEIGRTDQFGVVLSNPSWLRGFSVSVDYFRIRVSDLISTITPQQTVDLCFAGNTALCGNVFLTGSGSNPSFVTIQAINLASIYTNGLDIETSYQFGLDRLNLPGRIVLRALASHARNFITTTGIAGQEPIQSAGNNSGAIPHWKIFATQGWTGERASLTVTERWFSDGVLNRMYVECRTNCPAPTVNHPTIDDNRMNGALYFDIGGTYKVNDAIEAYFKVDNIADKSPYPFHQAVPNNFGANPLLYDVLGRTFRLGARVSF